MASVDRSVRVAVIGASGYTGAELVRLLARHPDVALVALTADRKAGRSLAEVFPHLAAGVDELALPPLATTEALDWSGIDVAFFGLPHGTTHAVAAQAPAHVKLIDLSPDFRFVDPETYSRWYGLAHGAPALQAEAVYGLTELARPDIAAARLVACPGCYPTASLLPLVPLVRAGLIDADDIIIDAKSGVSGAGRKASTATLLCEASESFKAYAVPGHRHLPEIRQGLELAAGQPVGLTFVPHLTPMIRGIHATLYAQLRDTDRDLQALYEARYGAERFVDVLPAGAHPETRSVRGANHCRIAVHRPQQGNTVVILSVIDNLVKGAAGQAVQNMNVMFGLSEQAGLEAIALLP